MSSTVKFIWVTLFTALLPLVACEQVSAVWSGEAGAQHSAGQNKKPKGNPISVAGEHAGSGEHKDKGQPAGDDDAGEREVHLTPSQRQRLDIKVEPAQAGSATAVLEVPATLHFDADRVARLGPLLQAKVVKVHKDLGDTVGKGETVAVFESVDLGRAKARYLTHQARYEAMLAEYQRDQKLAEQQISSQAELLQSKSEFLQAKAQREGTRAELALFGLSGRQINAIASDSAIPLSRYNLTAPITGVIQRRDLVPGQTVSAQETPIHIVNNEQMWLMLEVTERDVVRVKLGQEVVLRLRALPGETFTGVTDWVSSELDEQARTVRVRANLANPNGVLRAGMFGMASVQTTNEQRYALVPVDAVQTFGSQPVVFEPTREQGVFLATPVLTGEEGAGLVEIRSGLQSGDPVVVQGGFDLSSALSAGSASDDHDH